jgi:segregation and condensation protein B
MEQDTHSDLLLRIEAFLFHFGDPVRLQKVADFFEISLDECKTAIRDLGEGLESNTSPFMLLTDETSVQFVTKPEFQDISKRLMDGEFSDELSPASLETLSLIAYLGPISRPTLDFIRGVNSSFILRNLIFHI